MDTLFTMELKRLKMSENKVEFSLSIINISQGAGGYRTLKLIILLREHNFQA